ncbi:MAG: hypothetical protein IT416_01885 [Candidatus Pacebacteria bacterium]|nr:hypothetical protein [Candidatus Paceibacterota bacterium]
MLKKFLVIILILFGFFIVKEPSFAQEQPAITLHLFYGEGCPHCAKEKEFLVELVKDYPDLEIKQYEVYKNQNNSQLMYQTSLLLNTEVGGVPLTVIGDQYTVGYATGITDQKIRAILASYDQHQLEYTDLVAVAKENLFQQLTANNQPVDSTKQTEFTLAKEQVSATRIQGKPESNSTEKVSLPFFGEVKPASFSLPLLTVVLALIDGFNPCAMWTLLFLISLLLGMNDRRKMWILGMAFITASAAVYFVFLAAWLNLFLFLGFVSWIRLVVGVIALGAGGYYFYDFWRNKDGACKVTGGAEKVSFFNNLKQVIGHKSLLMATLGIVVLAVSVNLIELICSAGLPAIYTQTLSLANLTVGQYYFYLLLYILIFMLDDMLIFVLAMMTLKVTGIQGKYARFSHLVGGFLMLGIGILLIFKPEWLMFG